MFICDPCREAEYTNAPGFFVSVGPCEICNKTTSCSDIQSGYLRARKGSGVTAGSPDAVANPTGSRPKSPHSGALLLVGVAAIAEAVSPGFTTRVLKGAADTYNNPEKLRELADRLEAEAAERAAKAKEEDGEEEDKGASS